MKTEIRMKVIIIKKLFMNFSLTNVQENNVKRTFKYHINNTHPRKR